MGGFGQTPRLTSVTDTPGSAFLKGGNTPCVIQVKIASTAEDSGNTGQTHILRAGLTMGMISASKKWAHYDDGASDGTETAKGFLLSTVSVKDNQGNAADAIGLVVIGGQPLIDENKVYGFDSAAETDLANKFLWSTDYE